MPAHLFWTRWLAVAVAMVGVPVGYAAPHVRPDGGLACALAGVAACLLTLAAVDRFLENPPHDD